MANDTLARWLFYKYGRDTRPWASLTPDQQERWLGDARLAVGVVKKTGESDG